MLDTRNEDPALSNKEQRNNHPVLPFWGTETENHDPYQEPNFLIRNSYGV